MLYSNVDGEDPKGRGIKKTCMCYPINWLDRFIQLENHYLG